MKPSDGHFSFTISFRQARLIISGMIGTVIVLMAAWLVLNFKFHHGDLLGLGNRLNPWFEMSVHAWLGSMLLLLSGITLLLIAANQHSEHPKFTMHWSVSGTVLIAMSMDETVALHEMTAKLATRLLGIGMDRSGFGVFALGVISMLVVFMWPLVKSLPQSLRWRALASAVVFLGGAIVVEALAGKWAVTHGEDFVYHLLGFFEESLELTGAGMFLLSLLQYACDPVDAVAFRGARLPAAARIRLVQRA